MSLSVHREGKKVIIVCFLSFIILGLVSILLFYTWGIAFTVLFFLLVAFLVFFFRNPERPLKFHDDHLIFTPADGTVVAIEDVFEKDYFQSRRKQVSIFMSPLNVHLNRVPCGGRIRFRKYYSGKYLVAWHPKSSAENERLSVIIQNTFGEIMVKQIAGAMARRITNYVQPGDLVKQGQELGFIKFGSRVDVLLPINSKVKVKLKQKVKANIDVIAEFDV